MKTQLIVAGLLLCTDATTAAEKLNRGLIAAVNTEGKPYIGWRLLKDDLPNIAFNVYRQTAGSKPVKLNAKPITASTNIIDGSAPMDKPNTWFVRR
jgi:rhamnogalacturonan endolyase